MLSRQQVIGRVRIAVIAALVVGGAAGVVRYLMPRKFAAEVTLASVGPSRAAGLSALTGSLGLLGGSQGGFTASPAMVRSLLQSRRVAEQGTRKVYGRVVTERELNEFRRLVDVNVSRETGLIDVTLAHRDSALVRRADNALIAEVTSAFSEISRAQGRQQRAGLEERVDSAAQQLSRAEYAVQSFAASNRVVNPFSAGSVEQSRRQRNLQIAQTVYQTAINERDAAAARELEQAPAVVVVDPLPDRLPIAPQHSGLIGALAFVATLCLVLLFFAVRDQLAKPDVSLA